MSAADELDRLCEVMHDAYEKAAAGAGWETQERSRKPWADVPEANKVTMRAAVLALLQDLNAQGRLLHKHAPSTSWCLGGDACLAARNAR